MKFNKHGGMTLEEIGKKLGISPAAVSKTLKKAMLKLKKDKKLREFWVLMEAERESYKECYSLNVDGLRSYD